ncbi:MAG: glycosyltransferase [Acidobacteria bacterium]|nr:glycosyltransferase [Acidobacteriota bacterium]
MTAISLIIVAAALLLLCVALWNALAWPKVGDAGVSLEAPPPSVSILIPARDEESNIAACLDAALAQGPSVLEVLVYDDHSTDRTAEIVEGYAWREWRVRLVRPSELPEGWCGKTFACARLGAEAKGRWLLFLDADARLVGRDAVSLMVGEALARGVTLLSCWPRLLTSGIWEGALMPLLNFVVFTLYPAPLALRRDDPSLGLAHGSCVLARRDAYETVGGHASVRGELFEDVRLAQVWRRRGQRGLCLDGQGVVEVRMYRSLEGIWSGFRKNFFPAFRTARAFWAFVALHLCVLLAPFALAPLALGWGWAWGFAAAALCVLAARVALALRFGHPLWSAALHPLGEALLVALGLASWLGCRTGRGVEWKGRRYLQTEGAKE